MKQKMVDERRANKKFDCGDRSERVRHQNVQSNFERIDNDDDKRQKCEHEKQRRETNGHKTVWQFMKFLSEMIL